jgi:hypothetical protein
MKNILLLLTFISFGTAHAQLQISHIDYKVLASAQKDSVVAQSIDSMRIKEPNYMGGSSFLAKKISEIIAFEEWNKKKAGLYTAYVTKNWKDITVSTDNKKAKDIDLVAIATALKKTAPRWSSYTVGDRSIERYTFKIEILLEKG